MSKASGYADKPEDYFSGARTDIVDSLSSDNSRGILELGCGEGVLGAYARASGKCGLYVGIEFSPAAAAVARGRVDELYCVDVEEFDPPFKEGFFDVLIANEVLEHLVDPWRIVKQYRRYLKDGAMVFASCPNVAHRATIGMLLRGDWSLEDSGRMDRTHLRWFTPKTFREMFELAGYEVTKVKALVEPGSRAKVFNALTGGKLAHLTVSQIALEARAR
jgi:2-polyprenyl-3-methyl-5-hydroxy-6-metoxy-1,4-benzoquinol methylase